MRAGAGAPSGPGRGVMELVQHQVVEVPGAEAVQVPAPAQRLDGGEEDVVGDRGR